MTHEGIAGGTIGANTFIRKGERPMIIAILDGISGRGSVLVFSDQADEPGSGTVDRRRGIPKGRRDAGKGRQGHRGDQSEPRPAKIDSRRRNAVPRSCVVGGGKDARRHEPVQGSR